MITDKKFSLQILKSVLKRSRGLSDHHVAHPEREWFIGLSTALAALIAGTIWSIQLYLSYADIKPVSVEVNAAGEQVYRGGDVSRSLEALDIRKQKNDSLRERLLLPTNTPSFILIEEENDTATTTPENTKPEDPTPTEQPGETPAEMVPTIPDRL